MDTPYHYPMRYRIIYKIPRYFPNSIAAKVFGRYRLPQKTVVRHSSHQVLAWACTSSSDYHLVFQVHQEPSNVSWIVYLEDYLLLWSTVITFDIFGE